MNEQEYTKMNAFEQNYWWHQGKKHLVKTIINKYFPHEKKNLDILEIGCGTGEITTMLTAYGTVVGFDISNEAIAYCREKGLDNVYVADVNSINIEKFYNKFDLVLALDVLEHIQDDLETLKRVKTMLKPGGIFFVNVPAYKFLWSEHDEALQHKRRYSMYEMSGKLKDTGFNILKKTNFVTTAFPGIAIFRLYSSLFGKTVYPKSSYIALPKTLNNLMTNILKLEASIIKRVSLPFGTTITVVAKKPE